MTSFQRKNSSSNASEGKKFEDRVRKLFKPVFGNMSEQIPVLVGIRENGKKEHKFDLVSDNAVIECKTMTWTEGGNCPSAKIQTWSEAMFFFYLLKTDKKKYFVVEESLNPKNNESLMDYYIRTHYHLIPSDVIFIEVSKTSDKYRVVKYDNLREEFLEVKDWTL